MLKGFETAILRNLTELSENKKCFNTLTKKLNQDMEAIKK
jgi:hypothetical protein